MRGKGLSSLMVFAIGAAFLIFQSFMLINLLTNTNARSQFNMDDLMFQSIFMFLPALFALVLGANNINQKKMYHRYASIGVLMLIIAIALGITQIFVGYSALK